MLSVNAATFNKYLTRKLCWIDGAPTHRSSARQRQCQRCRRKWSYEGLAKRWILAQEYCSAHSRKEAAAAAGVDVHTAGRYYRSFDLALAGYVRGLLEDGSSWVLGDGERIQQLHRTGIIRPRSQRQRQRLAASLCFERLPFRRRLDLIFDLVFGPKVAAAKVRCGLDQGC